MVTIAAAFASAIGVFDLYVIFLLSILADTIADLVYYFIGHWGRINLIEKYGKKFGFTKSKVTKIENLLKKNAWATISAIKISPGLATVGLIITGASKIPFKKYIKICLYVTIPKTLLFVVLGFYAGQANAIADKYLHHSRYAFILIVPAILLANYIYQRVSRAVAQKIEKV